MEKLRGDMIKIFSALFLCIFVLVSIARSEVTIDDSGIGLSSGGITFPDGTVQTTASTLVYDGNNQYLGILAGRDESVVYIYVPSAAITVSIHTDDGDTLEDSFYFETVDCSGIIYSRTRTSYGMRSHGDGINKNKEYFIGSSQTAPSLIVALSAMSYDGTCTSSSSNITLVPVTIMTPPFPLPVALPLKIR